MLKLNYRRRHALPKWMRSVLRFAGWYNIIAGIAMMTLYHEGFKILGLPKPEIALPIQLAGVLVAVFGVGYLMVDRRPVENRNIVLLGFLSKSLGPLLAFYYIAIGTLPLLMIPVLFFADLIYLIPFWMIWKKLGQYSISPSHEVITNIKSVSERNAA